MENFWSNKQILITGGTGFLGKVLIEKLLRACPDIGTIYVLIRNKKGKNSERRVKDLVSDPLFSSVREQYPDFHKRIVAIAGDVSMKDLGLSQQDRDTVVRHVQVVFHAAATVRFDEKLRLATAINVQGTRDLLALCKQMDNLQSVVHVSTAYSHCPKSEIDEIFYKAPVNHETLLKLVDSLEDKLLDNATPALLDVWPNTYAYTKAVAEDAVKQLGKNLPIAVFRPSIVLPTWREPLAGWTDNIFGPTGIVCGAGLGIIRTLQADKNVLTDLVPVDIVVNALIATAWDTASTHHSRGVDQDPPVYNCVSSPQQPITWGRFTQLNEKYGYDYPSNRAIWYHCLTMHRSRIMHRIYSVFLHLVPAFFIDMLLLAFGKKPRTLKFYLRMMRVGDAIAYFSTRQWQFGNGNFQALWQKLSPRDQKLFPFDISQLDWEDYFTTHIKGLRLYLARDPLTTLPAARKRAFKLWILHRCTQLFFLFITLRVLWAMASTIFGI